MQQRHTPERFISLALQCNALQLGTFTLKSGKRSPFFFNMGAFNSGAVMQQLGEYYAALIMQNFEYKKDYDMLFGPAYKGIPLVVATTIALSQQYHIDVPYCFNRKEKKQYGEGGQLVGAPLHGKVLLLDDVITAGTAIKEAINMIHENSASICGAAIALDREEKGANGKTIVDVLKLSLGIPICSIINVGDIMSYLVMHQQSNECYKEYYSELSQYQSGQE